VSQEVLLFPQPDPSLTPEERTAEFVRLAEQLVLALDVGQSVEMRGLLEKLQSASDLIGQIGRLVMLGRARLEMEADIAAVRESLVRSQACLNHVERTGRLPTGSSLS
jgi:hypothetical protein